jgi:hypothetical protein
MTRTPNVVEIGEDVWVRASALVSVRRELLGGRGEPPTFRVSVVYTAGDTAHTINSYFNEAKYNQPRAASTRLMNKVRVAMGRVEEK